MSDFPSKAFDRWVTQTPEEYFGIDENEDDEIKICPNCGSVDIKTYIRGDGSSWIITCNKCNYLIDED